MIPVLAAKDNTKEAWNAIKVMRVAVDRVREARRQKLRRDFKNLAFKDNEAIEDFSLRLAGIITELQSLADTVTELAAVKKFLRTVPPRYVQMACSIETLLDLSELSIEELSGRLTASEGRGGEAAVETGGKLLLTEEEWTARQRQRPQGPSSSGGGGDKGSKPKTPSGDKPAHPKGDRKPGNCRYSGKAGHWAKECRKAQRDPEKKGEAANLAEEAANLTEADVDKPALFIATVEETVDAPAANLHRHLLRLIMRSRWCS